MVGNVKRALTLSTTSGVRIKRALWLSIKGTYDMLRAGQNAQGRPISGGDEAVSCLLSDQKGERYGERYQQRSSILLRFAPHSGGFDGGDRVAFRTRCLSQSGSHLAIPRPDMRHLRKPQLLSHAGCYGISNCA